MQVSIRGRLEIDDQTRGLTSMYLSPQSTFLQSLDYGNKPRLLVDVYVFSDNPLAESTFPDKFTFTQEILDGVKETIRTRAADLPQFHEKSENLKDFNKGMKEIEKGLKFFNSLYIAWNE